MHDLYQMAGEVVRVPRSISTKNHGWLSTGSGLFREIKSDNMICPDW